MIWISIWTWFFFIGFGMVILASFFLIIGGILELKKKQSSKATETH